MNLDSSRAYTLILAHAGTEATEIALQAAMDSTGLRPAVGLAITSEQVEADPHARTRRYFRLRPCNEGTLIVELGSEENSDYFLATSLAAAGIREVSYVALARGLENGVVARFHASRKPQELWLENGVVDAELSSLDAGEGGAAGLIAAWELPAESPRFDGGDERVHAFAGQL